MFKRFSVFVLMMMVIVPIAIAEPVSDEEYLDNKIEQAKKDMQRYKKEKEELEKKKAQEATVVTNVAADGTVTVSTTTTVTTKTTVSTEGDTTVTDSPSTEGDTVITDSPQLKPTPVIIETTPVIPIVRPVGERPISVGRLIAAEALGICLPGSGLAHFTIGDTRGGIITLAITGISALTFIGAEIAVETRTIDDPNLYGALHWGSIALFAGGFLYDVIGAPIYYINYNKKINKTIAYIKPIDIEIDNYVMLENKGFGVSFAKLNFEF